MVNADEAGEVDTHSSFELISLDSKKSIELSDCLKLFTQEEKLLKTEAWSVL